MWAKLRRGLESPYTGLVVVALMIVTLVLTVVVQVEVAARSRCVAHWADAFTASTEQVRSRSAEATAARQRRDDLLAELIVGAIGGHKATQPQLEAYVAAKVTADKAETAYQQSLRSNPVPAAPKYTC